VNTMRTSIRTVLAAVVGVALWPGAVSAHEGHDHGVTPPAASATIAPRAEASSDDFELVAIARGDKVRLYLDTFRTNDPVKDAVVEVDAPGGTSLAVRDNDGAYEIPAPWLARPGRYDLAISVQAAGGSDVLATTLVVPEPRSSTPRPSLLARLASAWPDFQAWGVAAIAFVAGLGIARLLRGQVPLLLLLAGAASLWQVDRAMAETADAVMATRDVAQRFPDGALFVPKPTQRILALRTLFTEVRTYSGTVELPGRTIPDPDGAGFVQAAVSGRLTPPPGGFPHLGTRVEAGDVLALVQPAVGAADVTTQQQQARELDQQITLAQRRLERLRAIQGVVARAQIEDAELELAGLRTRRENLDRSVGARERLVAPTSGVIASVQAVAGQIAEPNAIIFQIVDPARFWVEALSYEAYSLKSQATGRLGDNRTIALQYRGAGLADRNQAIPIQFSVVGDPSGLRAGQLLTVLASTTEERQGIAVPRESVLRGTNGQSIVYEHTNAERFVPREVRVEPLDGQRVLILSGIEAGRRIVTQGAELLNQIR